MTDPRHHAIDYVEFTVTDLAAAQRFYAEAFGWTFTDYGPAYAGIRGAGGGAPEVGGLRLDEQPPRSGGPLVLPGVFPKMLPHARCCSGWPSGSTIRKRWRRFPLWPRSLQVLNCPVNVRCVCR